MRPQKPESNSLPSADTRQAHFPTADDSSDRGDASLSNLCAATAEQPSRARQSGAPASKVPAPSRSARPQKPGAPLLSFRQKTSSNPGHFAPPTFYGDGSTSGASHPLTQSARCPGRPPAPAHTCLKAASDSVQAA